MELLLFEYRATYFIFYKESFDGLVREIGNEVSLFGWNAHFHPTRDISDEAQAFLEESDASDVESCFRKNEKQVPGGP